MCSPLPRWTGSASHMDTGKGSFHNGPRWGWDDGYGLLLGVNAPGLGPLQVDSVTSFAICQHWVGTNPWPGPGANTHQHHLQQHTPHFRGKVGRSAHNTQVQIDPSTICILQFDPFLLWANDCYTCSHWIIHSGFFVSSVWIGGDTRPFHKGIYDNKYNKTRKINSAPVSETNHLIAIALFFLSSSQYLRSMMVNPIHLHCRGNLIPRMFSFCE